MEGKYLIVDKALLPSYCEKVSLAKELLEEGKADAARLASRVVKLRIFEDEAGKTNRSIVDAGGSIIVVSQFTLYADTAHGNRPGFSAAARPELAVPLYESFVSHLRDELGAERVQTGRFGADMKVRLLNDGPFTVELLSASS